MARIFLKGQIGTVLNQHSVGESQTFLVFPYQLPCFPTYTLAPLSSSIGAASIALAVEYIPAAMTFSFFPAVQSFLYCCSFLFVLQIPVFRARGVRALPSAAASGSGEGSVGLGSAEVEVTFRWSSDMYSENVISFANGIRTGLHFPNPNP
jgi:hypothetical protein